MCLWPPQKEMGVKQFLKECHEFPPEDHQNLFDSLRKDRGEKMNDAQRTKGAYWKKYLKSEMLISATLGGVCRETICAENGTKANILEKETLSRV